MYHTSWRSSRSFKEKGFLSTPYPMISYQIWLPTCNQIDPAGYSEYPDQFDFILNISFQYSNLYAQFDCCLSPKTDFEKGVRHQLDPHTSIMDHHDDPSVSVCMKFIVSDSPFIHQLSQPPKIWVWVWNPSLPVHCKGTLLSYRYAPQWGVLITSNDSGLFQILDLK